MPELGGMILADTWMLESEAARGAVGLCRDCGLACGPDSGQHVGLDGLVRCIDCHDAWDNPDWQCDGWTRDTRVGLTPIGQMDIQLDELRRIIDRGFQREARP
jgi:hypothetical protein